MVAARFMTGVAGVALILLFMQFKGSSEHATNPNTSVAPTRSVEAFRESIGVATHLSYNDGLYADERSTLGELQYLGIHHVRDGIPTGTQSNETHAFDSVRYMMARGIRFTFILGGGQDISVAVNRIGELARTFPNAVDAVEGPNEIDNFAVPGKASPEENARAFQKTLYRAVHSNPQLHGVPVLYLTGGKKISLSREPGLADVQNTHPYAQAGQMPWEWIQRADAASYYDPTSFPKAATESGYSTATIDNYNVVDPRTQAELVITNIFDLFLSGHSLNAIYQLREAYPDGTRNPDTAFGLFAYDGSPKPVAVAIHRLTEALHEAGHSAHANVPVEFERLSSTAHAMVLTSAEGAFSVWVWDETTVWDPNHKKRLDDASDRGIATMKLALPAGWTVRHFDPLISEDPAGRLVSPVAKDSFQINIRPHPSALIFEPPHRN